MFNEIIAVYSKQLEQYNMLKEILERVQNSDFDIINYNIEFENCEYIINKIDNLNKRAEQLKLIYISRYNLNDFNGAEIKRVESIDNYNKLKKIIDSIKNSIKTVKHLQDSIINRISNEGNINKISKSNSDIKNVVNVYMRNKNHKY